MTVSTVKARDEFADIVNRVAYGKERVILTRRGKKLVAVVPIEDIKLLEELEEKQDAADAEKALKEKGGIPWDEVKKKLKL